AALNDDGERRSRACYHRLFEEQAAAHPDKIALLCGNERLTYRELNEHANRLAHHLHHLGVGPETIVGVCLPRSPQLLISLLAIAKAGGAYLPLEPDLPPARLGFLIDDSRVEIVVTESELANLFKNTGARLV